MFFLKRRVAIIIFALFCVLPLCRTAQAVDITTIASGLNGAYGCDHMLGSNSAFFVERYDGEIWRINMNTLATAAVGFGHTEPVDIVISADNAHAYIVANESGGTLLRQPISNFNRVAATVIATNIAGISGHIMGQLALDEAHGYAYVVQNSGFGKIWRINLLDGTKTEILGDFETNPWGLLLSNDAKFLYYTELGLSGKVKRLDLTTNIRETLITGLTNPSYLTRVGGGGSDNSILIADAGRISLYTITSTLPPQPLVTGLNFNTRSVRALSADRLLVCLHSSVVEVKLSEYDSSDPILLGIGHVPVSRIYDGYADTTCDPDYFFQVEDAPFGGTLSLMINHDGAWDMDARWYKVLVDGVEQNQGWSDYKWVAGTGFVLQTTNPQSGNYFPVRNPSDIWYNHWWGYRLDTSTLSNGLHTISIKLFKGKKKPGKEIGSSADKGRSVDVMIDNRWPTARIDLICHEGSPVDVCAIVEDLCGNDEFSFCLTAYDPDGHLLSWSLSALWGDNKSSLVDSDSYESDGACSAPEDPWYGISCPADPDCGDAGHSWHAVVDGDPTSWNCAHTFYLSVWDRTIDGYNHIHWSGYHKSITIQLFCDVD